jgi:hypothetical protein
MACVYWFEIPDADDSLSAGVLAGKLFDIGKSLAAHITEV